MIKKILIYAAKGFLGLLALLLVGFAIAAFVYRDTPVAALEAKWAKPPSKFVMLDGVRLHYRDEGTGPAVVLIHANYANGFMWESWAEALKDRYRVIRFDMTAHGLTGPDPSGDYRLERSVFLLEELLTHLGVQQFTLGGTSVGGTVAMHFAVKHPDQVERLILISPGSLEKDVRGRSTPPPVPPMAAILTVVTPRALAKSLLMSSFGDPSKLTEATVDEWYEMWMRAGNRRAMIDRTRQYISGDVEGKIASVTAPVLLLWGEKNPRVPVALAYEFQKLLVKSPRVELKILPGVGHMAVQEAPEETARLAREYLDAAMLNTSAAVSAETPAPLPETPVS
jgi:pimeloyl-ACP methyl ester carboxylesterase